MRATVKEMRHINPVSMSKIQEMYMKFLMISFHDHEYAKHVYVENFTQSVHMEVM